LLQDWDTELTKKQSESDNFSHIQQSNATTAGGGGRTVRSGPSRGGFRRRPVSDGQSYRNGGAGSVRMQATEPRIVRSSPYNSGHRPQLSSSEQPPVEV